MRAPFPLILPDSPSIIEDDLSSDVLASAELRRMSASYNNLRGLAQHQAKSSPATPLLPSPIRRDFSRSSEAYFKFHNPREQPATPASYDDSLDSLTILSYYCDDLADHSLQPGEESLKQFPSDRATIEDDNLSSASESMPVTPLQQQHCPTFYTDESDWLANTTSHDERLRRFKSRYYQVVQQPCQGAHTEDSENKVMTATMLVGPGKPKLVHIQRPPSRTRTEQPCERHPPPSTPKQAPEEVSAFSPYETPYDEPPRIDSVFTDGMRAANEINSCAPSPLALPKRSRSSRSDSIFSAWQRFYSLADPFEGSPRRSRSDRSFRVTEKRWAMRASPDIDVQAFREASPTTRSATWSRCRKLERVLHTVSRAIDDFPDDMLRLDSPAIVELRNPQISAQMYIETLQQIFPDAPSPLLSAMTAWIIVDLYFSRFKAQPLSVERYTEQAAASNDSLYRIPDKAREMLGIGIPDVASMRLNEYALRRVATTVQVSIGGIGQRLVEVLRGSWDEDIWRSLRVLVDVIESSPQLWA
ncbi:hypothetical protein H2200_007025 [Cladophialophora chaetospira]|uniref:Uncharacterized protein n=1 Tax=Cladophialophora chaetospira TaxID=386627 RepID=A0AA39CH46_9EURO|nr:hypothetical protein H2200_007025 [Cladophialophora chaetospira]